MSRKFGLISVIVLIGIGLLVPSAAAAPRPPMPHSPTPVCLITTSVSKEMICAELMSRTTAHGTFHSLVPVTLTVTLEYTSVPVPNGTFVVLASETISGTGNLEATTRAAVVPETGSVRACASAVESGTRTFHICASS